MKSDDLSMSKMLDFKPQEGRLELNGTRVLIKNADAMGALQKDLISTLGYERAKGFLIRYGWACGFNDALTIKQFDWDEDIEWLKSGPVLHSLEGVAHIDVEKVSVNLDTKHFFIKCKVINSFEGEQYLRNFGIHDSSVCWMLTGYAGGYISAFYGERVLYMETKCIGKGDPYCELTGRSLQEWGSEINSELPYYEEYKINEELEAANKRIQQQYMQLQRAFDIQEQLANLLLLGDGLEGITHTLANAINGSVFVFDNRLRPLSSYARGEMPHTILYKNAKAFLNNLISSSVPNQDYTKLLQDKEPLWIDLRGIKDVYPAAVVPIVVREEILAYITAVPVDKTTQDCILSVQYSAKLYALELIKQKTIIDIEQHYCGDFLDSLLVKSPSEESTLKAWGLRLDHDISVPHHVLAMSVDYQKTYEEKKFWLKDEVIKFSNDLIKTQYPSIFCGPHRESIIFLVPFEDKPETKNIINFIAHLRQKIFSYFPHISVYLGIGQLTSKVSDFRKSYSESMRALEIAKIFNKKDGIIFYKDLGSLALLFESNNKQGLLDFMERKLGALIKQDKYYSSELLKTLEQFLDNKSMQETSKETALSVSGLKYRLNKIRELGYDLQSPQERFDLKLALNIWKVIN